MILSSSQQKHLETAFARDLTRNDMSIGGTARVIYSMVDEGLLKYVPAANGDYWGDTWVITDAGRAVLTPGQRVPSA